MSDTPRTDMAISDARNRFVYDDISDWAIDLAKELERENAALRAEVKVTRQNYETYKADNIALRAELDFWRDGNIVREEDRKELISLREDKERLDWLMSKGDAWAYRHMSAANMLTRKAIDSARNEAQP